MAWKVAGVDEAWGRRWRSGLAALAMVALLAPAATAGGVPPFPAIPPFKHRLVVDPATQGPGEAVGTIQEALRRARELGPGTEILVRAGTYREGTLRVEFDGAPHAWNALRAFPGERPRILGSGGWETVLVRGSYFLLEGFEIDGRKLGTRTADGTPIMTEADLARWAARHPACLPSGENCGTGVHVGGSEEEPVHHVVVRGNRVHGFLGGGIQTGPGDFLVIEGNVTFGNAAYSYYGHSGISVFRSRAVETGENPPHRVIVRRNRSFWNYQKVPSRAIGADAPTDGNGIIVDSNLDTAYPYRTLVENNLVFENGGTGIHSFRSAHVDIRHNTSFRNSRNPLQDGGEILSLASTDVVLANNLLVARPGRRLNADWRNRDVVSVRNLLFGDLPPELSGPSDILADPRLEGLGPDPETARFAPSAGSPAVDAADPRHAVPDDLNGRPPTGRRDIGAVERVPAG